MVEKSLSAVAPPAAPVGVLCSCVVLLPKRFRDTASSKAAVKPTTVVATTKRIVPDNKRPSTRSQPADLEKADGMSRRLRYIIFSICSLFSLLKKV